MKNKKYCSDLFAKDFVTANKHIFSMFFRMIIVVSAPCGFILENWNLEKMQHVMQKKGLKKANKNNCRKKMQKNINAQNMHMQERNAK